MAQRTVPEPAVEREPGGENPRLWPRLLRQLSWKTWRGVLVRAGKGFVDDNCTDWAAGLTYYGVLAMFPAAIVVIALLRLFVDGKEALGEIVAVANDVLPPDVVNSLRPAIEQVVLRESASGALLSFGLLGAVWSVSNYIGAFTRASNAIYEVEEGRPFYVLRPIQVGFAAIALVLLAVVALALVISGPVAEAVGGVLGVGDSLVTAWSVGKWPVLVLIVATLLTMLYWVAPNVQQPRFRWLTVGGAIALVVWLLGSIGFGIYVANFGSYDKTYGSLGAIIAFLVWLYLTNSAIMLGVEVNAELQRGRRLQAGSTDVDPPLPPKRQAS